MNRAGFDRGEACEHFARRSYRNGRGLKAPGCVKRVPCIGVACMEAVLLIGIQGAGKSTFYYERFFHTHVRLSLDLLRTRNRERLLLEACLNARQPVVIDNTNVTAAGRARYILPAKAAGFRVAGYFFEPDPKGSLSRNNLREGRSKVPPAALYGTLKRLERPLLKEGFDELFRVRVSAEGGFRVSAWDGACDEIPVAT